MDLDTELRYNLLSKGASVVGFADLSSVPSESRKGFQFGIVIGVALNPKIVQKIYPGPSIEFYNEFTRVNKLLNEIDEYTSEFLIEKGYDALAKTQSVVVIDEKTKRTELPHKTIATLAGLGWIGKCSLLITKEYGSAIRISSVLTNAKLETGRPVTTSNCGNCTNCKDICPSMAVIGKNWSVDMDRDDFFKPFNCKNKMEERGKVLGLTDGTCSLCLWNCPWTQKYLRTHIDKN